MRILIDTNVLISAALFPGSIPHKAYLKAVSSPYDAIICDQNIDEIKRVFNLKFPHRIDDLNRFLATALTVIEIVKTPEESEIVPNENKIRDIMDRPIFRAASKFGAKIILTGDKDFLEAHVDNPHCISPANFIKK